jgi:hypothetical protein
MKYKIVVSNLWVGDTKYKRGEIVEIENGEAYGVKVEPYIEPVSPVSPVKKKRTVRRKKPVEKADG